MLLRREAMGRGWRQHVTHHEHTPQEMRAAAPPANAGEAGAYATSRTPKSLADFDNDATRKPVALE